MDGHIDFESIRGSVGASTRVVGVLAGRDMPADQLRARLAGADLILAADGAADHLMEAGVVPDIVVGDLDSASPEALARARWVMRMEDQDSSDCDKLLRLAADLGAAEITLMGLEGDQLDHVLGSLGSVVRSPIPVRIELRNGVGHCLSGPVSREFSVTPGARVSLMPLTTLYGVELSGVAWPLCDAELDWTGLTSLSNRSTHSSVGVAWRSGVGLLFLYQESSPT